ncbi:YbaB/EbfC family nucleoid-associated protein [Sphaerisporangium sp. B11E5]|uniref:YbaB/EbfC family nucleoid-associated protein n=1 Tax=Sphaerisporangium sp. B11E5 TaxID=3153563 RepID=UPI00325D46E2
MDFGDFAHIDAEKLLRGTQEQFARLEELQRRTGAVTGVARDENGLVRAEYTQDGLRDLRIDPRAMELSSGDLAELIKQVIAAAADDLRARAAALMSEVFGSPGTPPPSPPNEPPGRTDEEMTARLDTLRRRLDP